MLPEPLVVPLPLVKTAIQVESGSICEGKVSVTRAPVTALTPPLLTTIV